MDFEREILRLNGRINFYKELLLLEQVAYFSGKPRKLFEEAKQAAIEQMRHKPMPDTGSQIADAEVAQMEKDASEEAIDFFQSLEVVLDEIEAQEV